MHFYTVSEAGIIILPPPHNMDMEESQVNPNMLEPEPTPSKWPGKPGVPNYNLFDSEDSWYDGPPEGFSLTVSLHFHVSEQHRKEHSSSASSYFALLSF